VDRRPILICYDGSAGSVRAIETAAALLEGRIAVVVDIGPAWAEAETYAAVVPGVDVGMLYQQDLDAASERAVEGVKLARQAGFSAEPRGRLAAATWEGIIDLADEIDASVIVAGSRGLKGARELFEGSVSHELAEHAKRPVLIVPPSERRRA
jgi:nucleotide-binding universal stress UspA family protein